MGSRLKRYSITAGGFDPVMVEAYSAGAARYQIWRRMREAGYYTHGTFHDFLDEVYTLHFGKAATPTTPETQQ